jgi:hypothetical protein
VLWPIHNRWGRVSGSRGGSGAEAVIRGGGVVGGVEGRGEGGVVWPGSGIEIEEAGGQSASTDRRGGKREVECVA